MRNILAASFVAMFGSAAAFAQTPTGTAPTPVNGARTAADLGIACDPGATNPLRVEAIAYCQGFLTAAGQYHAGLNPPGAETRPIFCPSNPPPSVAQAGLAYAAWVRQNPQHGGVSAIEGLLRWAHETYPCPAAPRATGPAR